MLVLVFSLQQGGILGTESLENPLESASRFPQRPPSDAGSAFGEGFEIGTARTGTEIFTGRPHVLPLRTVPVGRHQYASALYPSRGPALVFDRAIHRVRIQAKWHASNAPRPSSLGVLLVTVTTYALVEGNFGTAYRHRAQVMPLFFVFAAKGLADWWAIRQQRISRQRRGMERARVAAFPGQHRRR